MNHFVMLSILALAIALVFALITKESSRERLRYFFKLVAYMVIGSLIGGWVMSAILW